MRCICINSAGLEAEQGHKVKLKVLTRLNFLTLPSFSVTSLSCKPHPMDPVVQMQHQLNTLTQSILDMKVMMDAQ